jgi:hypothetical protein
MLQTNGIPPRLNGRECEELICQQYWYDGKLVNDVDILFIKSQGNWHSLYFENGTVYWRSQVDAPIPFKDKPGDPFQYPLLDLGRAYGVKGDIIDDCVAEAMPGGARVVMSLEQMGKIFVTCMDNQPRIQYVRA